MSVTRIATALPGESLLGIDPELLQQVDPGWRRRLSLFTGRALTDTALKSEQQYRAGRLALLGQSVTPGSVRGLELSADLNVPDPSLQVTPGYGLLATGEDVTLLQPLNTQLSTLPVIHPLTGAYLKSFKDFTADAANKDRAGILLLQPVIVPLNATSADTGTGPIELTVARTTSCDQDPEEYAFEDWQNADGLRLVFVAWPSSVAFLKLPDPDPAATWRNRIAYTIFSAEAALGPDDSLPWNPFGVPVAIAGFDANWKLLFVDRAAVVRAGGAVRRRYVLPPLDNSTAVPGLVQPALAQARVSQLAEQLSGMSGTKSLSDSFSLLPPCGLLPAAALDLVNHKNVWFPPKWKLTAGPIHAEELETAFQVSMKAAPLDVEQPEEVEILVPLTDELYDPNLFVKEQLAPEFQQEFEKATHARTIALQHRKDIQLKENVLLKALGSNPVDLDAGLNVGEKKARDGAAVFQPVASEKFGTDIKNKVLISADVQHLRDVAAAPPYKIPSGNTPGLSLFTPDDFKDLDASGLPHFIDRIQARISRANDLLDLAFLTAQTDIYRFRQNVLGATDATRLATSPILANIATGETATATAANLRNYLNSVLPPPTPPAPPSSLTGTPRTASGGTPKVSTSRLFSVSSFERFAISPPAPIAIRTAGKVQKLSSGVTAFSASGGFFKETIPTAAPVKPAVPFKEVLSPEIGKTFAAPTASPQDIQGQSPIVGGQMLLRTLTVAERLKQSPAQEAMFYAVANRVAFLQLLLTLEIPVDDLPLLVDATPTATSPGTGAAQVFETHPISELRDNTKSKALWSRIQIPQVPNNADEASVFSAGVRVLEQHSQLLRAIEARIQQYRDFLLICQTALDSIHAHLQQAQTFLVQLDNDLAVARQNLTLVTALLADETKRVNDVNAARKQVLQKVVTRIAYARVRTVRTEADVPSRQLLPGNVVSPVPTCLQAAATVPPELRELVSLLREVPVNWLPGVQALLRKLERPPLLHSLAVNTQIRAAVQAQLPPRTSSAKGQPGAYAPAISGIFDSNQLITHGFVEARAAFQPALLEKQSWSSQLEILSGVAAVADLVDSDDLHAEVVSATSRLIQQISSVATCLYHRVGNALPVDRLAWAEFLRGPGASVPLPNLSLLPRWQTQSYLDRQQMQLIVDWLFQQIDRANGAAAAFMSDVVRVSILLASQAPANEIIAGEVAARTQPVVGGVVSLTLPSIRVAHGMSVQIFRAGDLAAQAVVSDLDASSVRATVTAVYKPGTFVEAKDVVHYSAEQPQFAALRAFAK